MEGRDPEGGGQPSSNADTAELRYQTLARLEALLRVLVDRYGARMTLGEVFAVTAGMARLCKQPNVSIAEIAEITGLPKQNLSRWAHKRAGRTITLKVNENDQRRQDVLLVDQLQAQEYVEALARILGIREAD